MLAKLNFRLLGNNTARAHIHSLRHLVAHTGYDDVARRCRNKRLDQRNTWIKFKFLVKNPCYNKPLALLPPTPNENRKIKRLTVPCSSLVAFYLPQPFRITPYVLSPVFPKINIGRITLSEWIISVRTINSLFARRAYVGRVYSRLLFITPLLFENAPRARFSFFYP